MKLYYAPGACSLGIHVLLEEIGKPYDLQKVDLQKGEQYRGGFHQGQSKVQGSDTRARRRFGVDRVPGDRHLACSNQSGEVAASKQRRC